MMMFYFLMLIVNIYLQKYSVTRDPSGSDSRGVYFTLAFAGVALMAAMVVGIVVLRRRNSRHPHNQVRLQF